MKDGDQDPFADGIDVDVLANANRLGGSQR